MTSNMKIANGLKADYKMESYKMEENGYEIAYLAMIALMIVVTIACFAVVFGDEL